MPTLQKAEADAFLATAHEAARLIDALAPDCDVSDRLARQALDIHDTVRGGRPASDEWVLYIDGVAQCVEVHDSALTALEDLARALGADGIQGRCTADEASATVRAEGGHTFDIKAVRVGTERASQ